MNKPGFFDAAKEIADLVERAGDDVIYIEGKKGEVFSTEDDVLTVREFKEAIKEQTRSLVSSQDNVNSTLKNINTSLKSGFGLGKWFMGLFACVVAVFFVVVVAFGLFLFHMSNQTLTYKEFYLGPSDGKSQPAQPEKEP